MNSTVGSSGVERAGGAASEPDGAAATAAGAAADPVVPTWTAVV
ncbi:hypothetical protein OAV42_01330 [Ilumatobacter sp.]|nr:hypothetical protein [Ilumatobacter sp.]